MRRHCFVLGVLASFLYGCTDEPELIDGVFTTAEWEQIATLSPLPDPPADPTNVYADDAAAAVLGQKLFFDKSLSGPVIFEATAAEGALGQPGEEHRYPCAACHDSEGGFIDTRSKPSNSSLGPNGWLARNTVTVVNSVYYKWSGWNGFIDTYWGHSIMGLEATGANNGDRLRTAHVLWDKYRDEYNAIFDPDLDPALDPTHPEANRFPPTGKPKANDMAPDGPYEGMTQADQEHVTDVMVKAAKAMHAYQRLLIRRNSPFDQYVAGDTKAINAAAKRGLKLFVGKAACIKCHEGPFFSDDKFHNIGVPQGGGNTAAEDNGRTGGIATITTRTRIWSSAGPHSDSTAGSEVDGLAATDADLGAFRTQSLRDLGTSAPYMHTGNFQTLREVVEFYNEGGKDEGFMGTKDELMVKLNLSESEIDDLVAFLEALNGEPIPAPLRQDTSVP